MDNHSLQILKTDQASLLPPLQILQILASADNASLGLVSDYLNNYIQREQKELNEDKKTISQHQEETKKNKEEILSLTVG